MCPSLARATNPMDDEVAARVEALLSFLRALVLSIQTSTPPAPGGPIPDWLVAEIPDKPDAPR